MSRGFRPMTGADIDRSLREQIAKLSVHRIQLSRSKGWRMPPFTKKVDRSTPWGNPYTATQIATGFPDYRGNFFPVPLVYFRCPPSLDRALDLYLAWLGAKLREDPAFLDPLCGFNIACWCGLAAPCHGDILLLLANSSSARPTSNRR